MQSTFHLTSLDDSLRLNILKTISSATSFHSTFIGQVPVYITWLTATEYFSQSISSAHLCVVPRRQYKSIFRNSSFMLPGEVETRSTCHLHAQNSDSARANTKKHENQSQCKGVIRMCQDMILIALKCHSLFISFKLLFALGPSF